MAEVMKILHLVPAECEWEPAVRVVALAAALREHGFASIVTAPDGSRLHDFAEAAGVEIAPLTVESSINPLNWLGLARELQSLGVGLIHAHGAEAARVLARAGLFSQKIPIVTTRYDARTAPVSAEYGSGVGAVICPSQALADTFASIRAAADKIRVVYDGVAVALTERAVEERDELRVKYRDAYCPDKEKPLFVVNIAPLEIESGQAEILEALAEITASLPQTHLFIMGEGEAEEDLYRQIKIMALEKDVSIIEPERSYPRLLAAADLYVSASRNDISGFMLQSALAAGRAAALSARGCYPEMTDAGRVGVLADSAKEQSLRDVMAELLRNRTQREHLGRQAGAWAARRFDIAGRAGETAAIYRGLLGGGEAVPAVQA